MFMACRKRADGGDIDSWKIGSCSTDRLISVEIIYNDPAGIKNIFVLFVKLRDSLGLTCPLADI